MSSVETSQPWSSRTSASPTTPRHSRLAGSTTVSPTKGRTEPEYIVIDDDSDEPTTSSHRNNRDRRLSVGSGSDTAPSVVEKQLLARDYGDNYQSSPLNRNGTSTQAGMDIDREPRTPTTTHEPPTSPSVSPKGLGESPKRPEVTPISLPSVLPVPQAQTQTHVPHQYEPKRRLSQPPLFTVQPLPPLSQAQTQVQNIQQHVFTQHPSNDPAQPPPLTQGPPPLAPSQSTLSQPTHKEKEKKHDSPKLPPKPLQQPTVRLEFFIDDPDDYEVDVLAMAKATGQRLPTPPPARDEGESSGSDDDEDGPPGPNDVTAGMFPSGSVLAMAASGELDANTSAAPVPGPGPKRRKRRNRDYDLDDPFIDDVDLAIDERKYMAQTTLQGFYVSMGDVALVEQENTPGTNLAPYPASNYPAGTQPQIGKFDSRTSNTGLGGLGTDGIKRGPGRPPKRTAGPVNAVLIAKTLLAKPLGKKGDEEIDAARIVAASLLLEQQTHSQVNDVQTSSAEIPTTREGERRDDSVGPSSAAKRKREDEMEENNKRRKVGKTEIAPFHPDLEAQLKILESAISKHDFKNKGKFPPDLKPILLDTAIIAITLGEYTDNFFNYLPRIFVYNRYTMLKLTKRLAYKDHCRMIHERQTALLAELTKMVNEGLEIQKAEHERALAAWEDRRAKKKDHGAGMEGVESTSTQVPVAIQNPNVPKDDKDGNEDKEEQEEGDDGDKDKPPTMRYRLNETMRGYLWALVQLSNDVCTLTNEKNNLEGSKETVSDQSQRKELYKKIMQAFPDGWMNTGTISREVSMMKKKMETTTAPKTEDTSATGTSSAAVAGTGTAVMNSIAASIPMVTS